jgi:hypothetical protein
MDDEELRRLVRQHHEHIKGLAEVAINDQCIIDSLDKQLQAHHKLFEHILEGFKMLFASRATAEADLAKLRELQGQFEAMQEMFGTKMARPRKLDLPLLSVIKGGADET